MTIDGFEYLGMFAQTSRLTNGASASASRGFDEQVVNAALVESMLIHTRELMNFLYAPPARNYIRGVDYLPDPAVIPPKWPEYNTDLAQIAKDTEHLTYDDLPNRSRLLLRVTLPERSWPSCVPCPTTECRLSSRS